jgi:hypothetical protein
VTRAAFLAGRIFLSLVVLAVLAFIVFAKAMVTGGGPALSDRFGASRGGAPGGAGGGKPSYHRASTVVPARPPGFCEGCHDPRPHRRAGQVRAMLNQHAGRMHCLVCHGRPFLEPAGGLIRRGDRLWPTAGGREATEGDMAEWRRLATQKAPCFAAGPGCEACHRPGGLIDFGLLGYGEEKARRLANLEENILKSVAQKWFYP